MRSILRSNVMSLKHLQNAHKMLFYASLLTFIFDLKIDLIDLEPCVRSSSFFVNFIHSAAV